ncbi:MAG: hypothetical protein ABIS67_13730, partial [Candidatus Eisenbacteria bacterium]
ERGWLAARPDCSQLSLAFDFKQQGLPIYGGATMTGLVRKATLLAVCGLLTAGAAFASVPSPANSTTPPCISLVGDDGAGTIDGDGQFTVTVRDLANFPINNSLVVIDFSACSGLNLCSNNELGFVVDCATQTVRGFTGAGGVITFRIKGHVKSNTGDLPPFNPYNCGKIFADGVLLSSPSVSAYDHDGSGMGPADLSAWLGDFFGPNAPSRSDYDCTGNLGPADLSRWLDVFFDVNANGGSNNNCPVAPKGDCPPIP